MNDKNEQQIGAAIYVVERVFTGTKTIQEVVTEEIIFTGKQAASFDQQDSRMVYRRQAGDTPLSGSAGGIPDQGLRRAGRQGAAHLRTHGLPLPAAYPQRNVMTFRRGALPASGTL